ncbi:MAG: S53 family peptidase [Chloroflexota bacterium]
MVVIPVDGGTTDTDASVESGLDVESASGMAPAAEIDYYEIPTDSNGSPTYAGSLDALNAAGSDAHAVRQISNSWAGCESSSASDPWTMQAEQIFASNAATGHNYFFSTGDTGSWCDPSGNGTGHDPFAEYPASSPNVTAVGGTSFNTDVGGSYPGESAWQYCACSGTPEGSGGGYSAIFSQPAWQVGLGAAGTGKRGYPDVSADGDPNTGAYDCWGSTPTCGQVGGTSLASPLWAGMMATLNSYLLRRGQSPLWSPNSTIYSLATQPQALAPFHDVTSGTNGTYNAGTGWDAVTGWGSPDLYNIAQDLSPSYAASYSASGVPTSLTAGQGANFSVTVTNTGSATWQASGATPVHLRAAFFPLPCREEAGPSICASPLPRREAPPSPPARCTPTRAMS